MSTVTSPLSATGYKKDSALSSYSDPKSGQGSALAGASRMAPYSGKPGSFSGLAQRTNSVSAGIPESALAASRYMARKAPIQSGVQRGKPGFQGEKGRESSLIPKSIFPASVDRSKGKFPIGPDRPPLPVGPDSTDRPKPPPFCPHNGSEDTTISDILEHIGNGDFGSAIRDAVESSAGQDAIQGVADAVQTIGNEMTKEE